MQMHRSTYRYVGQRLQVDEAYRAVIKCSERYPYFGYRKVYHLMREDWAISRERVRQIRRREGLQVVPKRRKRRVLGCSTQWVHQAKYPNHVWSYDFVFDQTEDGRLLKCLTVVDEFTRQGLTIQVARSLTATAVTDQLDALFRAHGRPVCIRSDNGPEFVSQHVQQWLKNKQVDTHYIEPGSPWQNGYNESFNSIVRTTCLDRCLFGSLTEARVIIQHWLDEYNTVRPHGSLGGLAPETFVQRWAEVTMDQQPKPLTQRVDQRSWA